jgi:hypothetical protein
VGIVARTRKTRNSGIWTISEIARTIGPIAHVADLPSRVVRLLTSGELARELGVSRSAVLKWTRAGMITPDVTTPGGHHRYDLDKVRAELRQQRQRGE